MFGLTSDDSDVLLIFLFVSSIILFIVGKVNLKKWKKEHSLTRLWWGRGAILNGAMLLLLSIYILVKLIMQ